MTPIPTFASPKLLAVFTLGTAAALFAVERWTSGPGERDPNGAARASVATPTLEVTFAGLPATGAATALETSFLRLSTPALGPPALTHDAALVPIADATELDLVAVLESLRLGGFAPRGMVLSGLGDVVLEAELPEGRLREPLDASRTLLDGHIAREQNLSRGRRFDWLERVEITAGPERATVRLVARAHAPIDALDALRALEAAGLAPRTLKLSTAR